MKKHSGILTLLLAALIVVFAFNFFGGRDAADVALPSPAASSAPSADIPAAVPSPGASSGASAQDSSAPDAASPLDEHGSYTTKDDVALYIHTYGRLPDNFVTKKEAESAGWSGGSLEKYLPGKCIGGSRFGNYEELRPDAEGRKWTECDINTLGASSRGAERIVFSNDGLIYYTADHYESFEQLY